MEWDGKGGMGKEEWDEKGEMKWLRLEWRDGMGREDEIRWE